jgi:hypothetical protein
MVVVDFRSRISSVSTLRPDAKTIKRCALGRRSPSASVVSREYAYDPSERTARTESRPRLTRPSFEKTVSRSPTVRAMALPTESLEPPPACSERKK